MGHVPGLHAFPMENHRKKFDSNIENKMDLTNQKSDSHFNYQL